MSDDPHDEALELEPWLRKERVFPPTKPTLNPRIREDHDQHWDESQWKLNRWHIAAVFIGGAVWASIIYSAYLIYMGVTQ